MRLPQVALAAMFGVTPMAAGWYIARELTSRRTPDPVQHPDRYDLHGDVVRFPARDGTLLRGWWLPADEPQGTIIFVHGQAGSLDGDLHLAPPLVMRSFNVLTFDLRAHGRSAGTYVTFGAGEVLDVRGALDWLEQQQSVERIGVLGFSMGGAVALTTAAHDRRIAAIVADSPFYRLHTVIVAGLREQGLPVAIARPLASLALGLASLAAGYALDVAEPARWVPRVRVPVLLIAAGDDRFIPGHETKALYQALPASSDLWRVPDIDHREAYRTHPDAYAARVAGWFETHLPGPASRQKYV